MEIAAWIYFVFCACFWLGFYLYSAYVAQHIINLPIQIVANYGAWPKLSVIVTAKDEQQNIATGMHSLLQQNYPNYEIIVVNDRSTDETGKILDQLASQHTQLKVIHILQLPEHWLGKTHALHTAVAHASGEWLLFTDADVQHDPFLWQRSIQYAQNRAYDFLALLPNVPTKNLLFQATLRAFSFLFLGTAKVTQIENPGNKAAIGIGAFNLVRQSAFKHSPGFEWLRMEVADDYGLGYMMKQHQFKIGFASAKDALQVAWYPNISAMIRGLDKNIMAVGTHFSRIKLFISPFFFCAIILAPFISLFLLHPPFYFVGLVVFSGTSLVCLLLSKNAQDPIWPWLLTPIGFLIIAYTFTRACLLCLTRDGIIWRDTHYPRKLLQKYQRIKL